MHGSKLNLEAVTKYSQSYSQKILDEFYSSNQAITGQQIIGLTPIKQINFFVLKVLFEQWQEESKKFRSPFFDYKNEEVSQALKTLVNTLSKHIMIEKDAFLPLFEKAVFATIHLMYDPLAYYSEELNKLPHRENIKEFKAAGKYVKLYKDLFDSIVTKMEHSENDDLIALQAIVQNDASTYAPDSNEIEEVEALFNDVLELNIFDAEVIEEELTPVQESIPQVEEDDNFFDSLETVEQQPVQEEQLITPVEETPQTTIEEITPQQNTPSPEESVQPESKSINEQYAEENIQTLNERFEKEEEQTIASSHESKPISELASSININQRYMFVNDLFDGNEADYEAALNQIEASNSFDSSVEILVQNYSRQYSWDMNSDEIKEFLKVIFKRFR